MFKNLRAEMGREMINGCDLAKVVGITPKSFSQKMVGKTEFTRSEMMKIKKYFIVQFKNELTLEYLFDLEEYDKSA